MDDRQVSNIIKLEKKFTALWLAAGLIYFYLREKKSYRLLYARLAFAFAICLFLLHLLLGIVEFSSFPAAAASAVFCFSPLRCGSDCEWDLFCFMFVSVGAFEYFGMIYCLHADRVLFWLQDFEGYGMMM
jgi:hypothetical protein